MNVWILLQGQNVACKILPKLKRCAYVGYDEGSKSVIYYNAKMRRCLTSRNYTFLTSDGDRREEDDIIVQHDITRKGEREEDEIEDAQPCRNMQL